MLLMHHSLLRVLVQWNSRLMYHSSSSNWWMHNGRLKMHSNSSLAFNYLVLMLPGSILT